MSQRQQKHSLRPHEEETLKGPHCFLAKCVERVLGWAQVCPHDYSSSSQVQIDNDALNRRWDLDLNYPHEIVHSSWEWVMSAETPSRRSIMMNQADPEERDEQQWYNSLRIRHWHHIKQQECAYGLIDRERGDRLLDMLLAYTAVKCVYIVSKCKHTLQQV